MSEPADKITDAVDTCVTYATDSDRPFRQVADFLLMLRSAGWSVEELGQVQNQVLNKLGERHLKTKASDGA